MITKPKDKGTVVILGAGASKGASINDAPPVMNNFINVGKKELRGVIENYGIFCKNLKLVKLILKNYIQYYILYQLDYGIEIKIAIKTPTGRYR